MVFVKHNSLKSDILFNPIFIPGFSGSRFFRAQVFQGPGFSGSRFFRVRVQGPGPESRVRVWVQGPGSRVRVQGSGPRSRLRVQVLEVAIKNGSCYKKAKFPMKLLATLSLIQMMYGYGCLSKTFALILRNFILFL